MTRASEYKPELYDDIAPGFYDEVHAEGKGMRWFWHRYRFAEVVDAIPPSGESILDVGCGPGTFLGHYAGGYRRAVGIDVAQPQIEYARSRYGSERLHFETRSLEELSDAFDVITSIEVIEHLPAAETQPFLRSLFRLLKPGGTLVLTTPNYRSFWPPIEWAISKKGPVDYTVQHINRFHARRLSGEVEKAGLHVRQTKTFYIAAPFLAPISTRLAEFVNRRECRLFPRLGSELLIAAEKR